jgi:sensor histidine kinase YesM
MPHEFIIDVIDNSCEMTKKKLEEVRVKINDAKSKNIGLTNLNHRLTLHYDENSKLLILSKRDMGTAIIF